MREIYDAIIVGARCAGSTTAMLLARKGYRVLLVDRARFPSDTVSTHVIHPPGVAALSRWGLLDRLIATGIPDIGTYAFNFGPLTIEGTPGTPGAAVSYCPRRTVLDKLLIDAAAEAGVEVREGFTVTEVVTGAGGVTGIRGRMGDGSVIDEHARVVVGADGRRSLVAESVQAPRYNEKPPLLASYYAYFSGLPMAGRFEIYVRPNRGFAAAPTHDGLTMIVAGWPYAEFAQNQKDLETHFFKALDLAPEFAARAREGKRESRFAGTPVPNFFRKPYGAGWVLVGDAGYNKDPITAQGISDAFRDAERCASGLDEVFSRGRPFEDAMAEYQHVRDAHVLPMYEFTCQLAMLEPPPPEMQQLFAAMHGNTTAMTQFVQMNAGTISPSDFFAPENVEAIMRAGR